MTKQTVVHILVVLVAVLAIAHEAAAQVAGTISGYVRDESGAVIPGATVTATMVGQQVTRSAVSDETGFFDFLAMPSGVVLQVHRQIAQGNVLAVGNHHCTFDHASKLTNVSRPWII